MKKRLEPIVLGWDTTIRIYDGWGGPRMTWFVKRVYWPFQVWDGLRVIYQGWNLG